MDQQARGAVQPQRCSVAGQMGCWASLDLIAEGARLTVGEARETIALFDALERASESLNTLDGCDRRAVRPADARDQQAKVVRNVQWNHPQAVADTCCAG